MVNNSLEKFQDLAYELTPDHGSEQPHTSGISFFIL